MHRCIIGLTGNIASGKSTVSKHLRALNCTVIDADVIARQVVTKGSEGLAQIASHFGSAYLKEDGELNRSKLGSLVFSDATKLQELNAITHPLIREVINTEISLAPSKLVFVDGALLFETKFNETADAMWMVHCAESVQLRRVMDRDNLSEKEALARINTQGPIQWKLDKATEVLTNNGSEDELRAHVAALVTQYLNK